VLKLVTRLVFEVGLGVARLLMLKIAVLTSDLAYLLR
jgi:hypothetical protein